MITKKKKREELQYLRDEALQAYQNRPDFQYDANVDALYRHYKDRYTELGKKAMTDTMSQAAALTGGYGSSYAQNVGQQAYQSYLGQLDDVIPALYQLAYDRYQDKVNDLYKTYQSWAQLEQQATQQEQWAAQQAAQQEQWKARQEQWAAQQAALQEQWAAQQALQQERWAAQQALQKEQWEREYELKKRKLQEANRRIQQEQERKNSQTQTGTSQPDYWAMLSYHQNLGQRTQSQKAAAKPNYDNGNVSEGNIKTMQRVLGLQETGKWAENEYQKAGSLNADDAWLSYQKGQLQNRHSHGQWEQGATVGNIKTMERVLGLEEDGYWSKKDQKTAGGQTAFAAWKDYQQGKLQSRSRSGMSMDEWAELKKVRSTSSGFDRKETTPDVREFIGQMMTKEQAAKRGITSKEWETMVLDRLNHVKLSVDEFDQLEKHYGLDIEDGKTGNTGTVNSSAQKLSYAQYRQKTAAKKVADYQTAVQRYFKDYQAFANSAVYDGQSVGYHNAESMLEVRVQTAADLRKRADTLLTALETSGDILAGDYSELLESIASTQQGIDSVMDFFGGQVKYYSNLPNLVTDYYDNEIFRLASEMEDLQAQREDYINNTPMDWTDYTSRQKYMQGLRNIEAAIEKAGTEKYQLEAGKQYQIMRFDPDYAELSKQKPTAEYVPNLSPYAAFMHIQERNFYDNMTQDQIADYNYLYAKEGKEAADKYVAYISSDVNARIHAELNKTVSAIADKAPITSSLLSTPVKLMGGSGLVDVGLQKLERELTGSYKPIDYNTPNMAFTNAGNAIRGTVSQKIADATGTISIDKDRHPILSRVLNGKSLADTYQLGMSMQDSAAIAGLAAINPVLGKIGTVLLSTSSGTDAMLNAVSKGASDEQALTMGILAAGFEMIFEKYELESLLGQGENIWQAVWRQGLSEAVGEGTTEAANILADVAVMAERSDWQQNIRRYLAENPDWDHNQAAKQAFIDAALQVGEASFGGWISGSTMGGGYSAVQNIAANLQKNQQAYDLYGESQQELVREALELNPNNAYALKLQGKLDGNNQLSGAQLGKLAAQNDSVIQDHDMHNALTDQNNTVGRNTTTGSVEQLNATVQAANNQANATVDQEAVAKSLRSKGISYKKADGIAEVIVARLNGQELTRTQRERLSSALGNPTVQSVISKLIKKKADGIDSVQNSMYDEGNISGINDGEEAARWELLNQRTDVFGDNDATVTEGSTLHKAQNAYSEGNHGGGGNALKFNNWDDMKSAYKGTITQFIKENKPKYSPEIRKWFNNGGLIEIQDIDGKQIWTYTSSAGISVPYIDGYIKFPDEYLNPTIKSVDIGEFTGDRGSDIDKMLSILQADYGINEIPDGYTVHHDIVNGILQLVDENIHTEFTHIGGYSIYR